MAEVDRSAQDLSGWFAPPAGFGADYHKLLIEQYKIYVDSSTKVSERRANAQTFFLTANTLLSSVYGLAAGAAADGSASRAWQWLVPLAGLMLALSWFVLIRAYSTLNAGKFKVIAELEKQLPARMFDLEWQMLEQGKGRAHIPLTHIERLIPLIFALFFLLLMLRAWSIV